MHKPGIELWPQKATFIPLRLGWVIADLKDIRRTAKKNFTRMGNDRASIGVLLLRL